MIFFQPNKKAHQEDFKFRKPNMSYLLPMTYNGCIRSLSTDLATKSLSPSPSHWPVSLRPGWEIQSSIIFTSYPILFSRDVIVMVSIIDQELCLGPGWAASTIVSTVSIINSYFWACAQFADFWVWAQPELSICCASQKDRSSGDQNDTTHLLRPFVVTHMALGSRPRWVAEYPHPPGWSLVPAVPAFLIWLQSNILTSELLNLPVHQHNILVF